MKRLFHLHQNGNLVDKPEIYHSNGMYGLVVDALPQRFRNDPDSLVIHNGKAFFQLFYGQFAEIIAQETVHMLLQRTDRLHQCSFKVITDTHNLTGGFHLCCQSPLCRNKFIEGQSGNLHHAIVQRRFKGCIRLLRNGVLNLIQCVAQCDLCRHLCNGIAGGLGRQRRRTAHTGIHLNYTVFEAGGMQRKLYITAAGNFQLTDNVQGGGAQHLVLFVAECLGRRHHNTVTCMHAHRINVFHITNGDTVARAVTHDLILYFLPAGDTALHQYLPYPGEAQPVLQNFLQLCLIAGDTAAGASQRIGRTQHHGITYGIGKPDALLHVFHYFRRRTRFSDALHQILKLLTPFGIADGSRRCAQKRHSVGRQKSGLLQLHTKVQAGLPAQSGKYAVRLLLFDNLFQDLHGQRFNVYLICNIFVRHNGGGIRIYQNDLHALFLQRAACLCARIVELCRLPDDNGAGSDYHDTFYIGIFRHCDSLLSP